MREKVRERVGVWGMHPEVKDVLGPIARGWLLWTFNSAILEEKVAQLSVLCWKLSALPTLYSPLLP